ncbi:MAG: hypothetical protein K8S25_06530 [Alphaproteobacteria bacterium]|nr:hypothetical protein [Alphaproteobacteria bacterium]
MNTPQLTDAIQEVYAAFRCPKPRVIEGCPCCTDPKEVSILHRKVLSDLTPKELSNYSSSAFLTMGGERDFRYFLPRILEIAVSEKGWWPSPEVVIGKLKRAHWENWDKSERRPIVQLLEQWFEERLNDDPVDWQSIDALVCGIAIGGIPIDRYLVRISEHHEALTAVYEINSSTLWKKGRLSNAFWKDNLAASQPVIDFFNSQRIKDALKLT